MEDQKRTWVQTSNSIWFFRLIQQNKQEPIIVQLLEDQKTIKGLLEFVGDLLKTFQPMLASEKISNLVFVGEQKIPTVTSA